MMFVLLWLIVGEVQAAYPLVRQVPHFAKASPDVQVLQKLWKP